MRGTARHGGDGRCTIAALRAVNMPKKTKASPSSAKARAAADSARSKPPKVAKKKKKALKSARVASTRAADAPRKRAQGNTSRKRTIEAETAAAKLPADDLPIMTFETAADWERWLERQHKTARGVWVKFAKKGSGLPSIDRTQAVDGALCYGWIDGQGRSVDEQHYMVKFTPRSLRSIWSKINTVKALSLIELGLMKPAGLEEVERAQRDGRWEAAYDSPRTAAVPEDLAAALAAHPRARSGFAELNAANRYAILWQLQTAKRPETRARRIQRFVQMLERGEALH